MNIDIQVIKTEVTLHSNKAQTGSYHQLELTYKGTDGKAASKKVMDFASPVVFKALENAKDGECFTITQEKKPAKDGKEYWTWMNAVKTDQMKSSVHVVQSTPQGTTSGGRTTNTYETPEERAKKQIYIVRQSSISSAIEMGAKSVNDVLNIAKQFESFVFTGVIDGAVVTQADKAAVKKLLTTEPVSTNEFNDLEDF